MASIPNDIVAKDSGGNIKKVDLSELLASYVTTEDVQDIVSENLSECLKSVNLSLNGTRTIGDPLEIPFLISGIKLYTAAYDSQTVIYSTSFPLEQKELQKTTDAYRFIVESNASQFGVSTNQKCFLVMSFDGYDHFGGTEVYEEDECRRIGAHGGNPILLDWGDMVLGEGRKCSFAYKDPSQQVGVFGSINLIRRTAYSGNLHSYAFRLEFVICGVHAWRNFLEGNRLNLEMETTADASSEISIDLNPVIYPKIVEVGVAESNEGLSLATDAPSKLSFKAENGISIQVEDAETENASIDEKVISVGVDLEGIAGSGIALDNEGKLSVPQFAPASGSEDAVSGLVPSASAASFDSILTVSGWKTFEELGLSSSLSSFIGATTSENGEMGFVPKPLIENRGSFLRGDGTWSNAVSEFTGEFQCTTSPVQKKHSIGISLCDANGRWLFQAEEFNAFLTPDESEEGSIQLGFSIDDIHGVSICSPWTTEIPVSEGSNSAGWIADKTFWSESKEGTFSVSFAEGHSAEAWLSSSGGSEQNAILHWRIKGCQLPSTRSFALSIDGVEQEFSCLLAESETQDFTVAGSVIKVWAAGAKSRILHDILNASTGISNDEELEEPLEEVPWGGFNWIDQNEQTMLQNGKLVYIEDAEHFLSASIRYELHQDGSPILVYGLNPQSDFWDIILQESIQYNGEAIPAGTTIGHVWRDGNDIKAASVLLASWSIQPALHESNEPLMLPQSTQLEQASTESYDYWIDMSSSSIVLPFLGIELSKTADGLRASAFQAEMNDWPERLEELALALDCGFKTETISASCLKQWANNRLESHDLQISSLEDSVRALLIPFSGATDSRSGKAGLVPEAFPEDRNKVLMGDGTWSDGPSTPFSGAESEQAGTSGLVPAPQAGDEEKYLKGDGTWSIPDSAYPFSAISELSLSEIEVGHIRRNEKDYQSCIEAINALLVEHPDDPVYVTTDMVVTGEAPEESCIFIQRDVEDGVSGIRIGELVQIEDEDSSEDSSTTSSFQPLQALVEEAVFHEGETFDVEATAAMDDNGSIQLATLNTWNIGTSIQPNGIRIGFTNTVTGEETSSVLELLYQGATSVSDGASGLVIGATSEQRDMFFRGDGTWQEVKSPDVYIGATTSSDGISGLVPAAIASEWNRYLRGDGSWIDLNDAVVDVSGSIVQPEEPSRTMKHLDCTILVDATYSNSGESLSDSSSRAYAYDGLPFDGDEAIPVSSGDECFYDFNVRHDEDAGFNAQVTEFEIDSIRFSGIRLNLGQMEEDQNGDTLLYYSEGMTNYPRDLAEEEFSVQIPEIGEASEPFILNMCSGGLPDGLYEEDDLQSYSRYDSLYGTFEIRLYRTTETDFRVGLKWTASEMDSRPVLRMNIVKRNETQKTLSIPLAAGGESAEEYVGATSSADGISGLVPAARSEERSKVLHGDGTWSSVAVVTSTIPQQQDDGNIFFYIED